MPPAPRPSVADRYTLIEPLGEGGMGRVWLARDVVLNRDVAVKEVVPPAGLSSAERNQANTRSLREARSIARLTHPNVVRIYDVVPKEPWPWIVMEYVPARSLQQVINQDGPLPPVEVARIGLGILGALRAAHQAGVLHRDVKPGNVLLATERVVLTDFGLATMEGEATITRSGMILGSPAYISPERARDGQSGPESDLWSLGATLYAAVEGQAPFQRTTAIATLTALATELPEPARRAGPLRPVLDGLLQKDPAQRMDAAEAERLLRRVLARSRRVVPRPAAAAAAAVTSGPARPVLPGPCPAGAPAGPDSPGSAVPGAPDPAAAGPGSAVPMSPAGPEDPGRGSPAGPDAPGPGSAGPAGPAAAPAPRHPTAGAPAGAPGSGRPGPIMSNRFLAAGAVVLLVLLAAVATGIVLHDRRPAAGGTAGRASASAARAVPPPTPGSRSSSPAGTSASRTEQAGTGGGPPPGWHTYHDPTGFGVVVPDGWTITHDGSMVYFHDPTGGRLLGIDQTDQPKPDPVADWRSQAQYRVSHGDFPGYREIRIEAVDYHIAAADWEFTYLDHGVPTHVINRGAVFGRHQAYGIYWSTPDSVWSANLANFDLITSTFQGLTG